MDVDSRRYRALGGGYGLALNGGKLVTQLGHAMLKLGVALIELGQALGGQVAAGFAATDGLQHALALLATPLLFRGELRHMRQHRGIGRGRAGPRSPRSRGWD